MDQRKRIGLYYESYSTLPAFVIYIQNLVRTLLLTPDERKPCLVIMHLPDSPVDELKALNYPFIEFYKLKNVYRNVMKRIVNKASRPVLKRNLLPFTDPGFPKNLDIIFPYNFRPEAEYVKHKIVWKPDFQEFHLPTYFTPSELEWHKQYLDDLSSEPLALVLSSQDSRRDYERYYPKHVNDIHIWPFTSFLPEYKHIDVQALKKRYGIEKPYFVVANQFWPHKNHLNVLKAMISCLQQRGDFQVVFTGKQKSSRDKDLFSKLQQFIRHNGLGAHTVFTGFIQREEQIALMSGALAVIQPSTFEGWSTVIEDCKALGQYVLASGLSVNREQIHRGVTFFDPYNYKELAEAMLQVIGNPPQRRDPDYIKEIQQFNQTLCQTFKL